MKMVEISYRSKVAELEKLNARKERAEAKLQKAKAKAEKLGVAEWSMEDFRAYVDTMEVKDGWFTDKKQVEKKTAWSDRWSAEREVEDIKEQIERAEKRFEKAQKEIDEYRAEVEKIADLKRKEELFKLEFEKEQKEWAKDGIKLEIRYAGETPNGNRFCIERNWGFTERSLHCYTLYINGNVVFTSGEFWRAYGIVRNS